MSEDLGVSVKRSEDFSQWYLDVVRKGNFIDQRSPIKGFDVILPWGYAVWERIQQRFDELLKEHDVKNAYFPMFIPEHLIKKEEEHFKGFKAETFVVTEAGGEKLDERLYVRPTSETIMYYMYALWIRSYKDLPLKINQWNNVIRFDTKVTKPFLRGREFIWSEAHTAHATREDAVEMVDQAVGMYGEIYKMLAIEPLILVRPQSDTFAGADFSVVFDTLLQDGKVSQGPGTHMLGQHFSKPFNIQYLDKNEKKQYVWQTSWGLSTRQLGILIMHHGDDKGAIIPPLLSPLQVVIVPILFKGKEQPVIEKAKEIEEKLKTMNIRTQVDDRDYSAGFKFNEWELRGVPLRLELGPRDMEAGEAVAVNRIDGTKVKIKFSELGEVVRLLAEIQNQMTEKSKKLLAENIRDAQGLDQLRNLAQKGFWLRANWCGAGECEKNLKAECGGAEIRGTLYRKEETPFGKCVYCNREAKHVVYIAKAY